MILDICLIVYAAVALFSARLLAGHLAWKYKSQLVDRPEGFDWLGGACFGLLGGLVWPLLLLVRGVRRLALPAVGAEQEGRERLRAEELRQGQAAAEQHLAELERNLDDDPAA